MLLLYACLEALWYLSNSMLEGSDLNPKNVIGAIRNDYFLHIPKSRNDWIDVGEVRDS